jgi:hypothetical protein
MSKNEGLKVGDTVVMDEGTVGTLTHVDYEGDRFIMQSVVGGQPSIYSDHLSMHTLKKGNSIEPPTPAEEDLQASWHDNDKPGLGDTSRPVEEVFPEQQDTANEPNPHSFRPGEGRDEVRSAPAKKAAPAKKTASKGEVTSTKNFG